MKPIYVVAIISFISGALGYIILYSWILPILLYKNTKNKIALNIKYYNNSKNNDKIDKKIKFQMKDWIKENRKNSVELSERYNRNLPVWYKLFIKKKGESPVDASKHLMILSNTKNCDHAEKHIGEIKKYLKIE